MSRVKARTGPAARQRRYRERHRIRIDYLPAAGVAAIIEQAAEENPAIPLRAILDHLVRAGAEHFAECAGATKLPAAAVAKTGQR